MDHGRLLYAVCALVLGATATAATIEEQQRIAVPPGASLILEAATQGVQIYTCEKAADGYRWAFTAPEAALFDAAGRQIGTHSAGPAWQLLDGSKIVGEVAAQAPAAEPHAIAWLLLRVKTHEGSGVLSGVELVRRVDTQGGAAPTAGCDAAQPAAQARMRYTARYLFYAAPH
jgi:Protein of unknown function (DUF3455)